MKTPLSQRAAAASLALSLALHLGLVLWLSRTPPPAQPTARPVEIEIVERPKPVPPKAPEPKPEPPRPAPPRPAPPKPEPKPKAPRPKVAQAQPPPAPAQPAQPPPVEPPPAEPQPDVPREEPKARPALPNFADAARQLAGAQPGPSEVLVASPDGGLGHYVHPPEVLGDASERVATMLGGEQGKRRVERGLVDPYFGQVSKALAKVWNPEPKVTERSLEGFLKQGKQNMVAGTQIYGKLAEAYGAGGSPLGPTDEPHGAQTQAEAVRDYRRKMVESWKQSKRTVVRITQGAGGMLQHVELVQSSADPAMDAEIIRELQEGVVVLPTPPASGQGIKSPIRSVWSFELVISISPPVPTLNGSFDEVTGHLDVRMPLDRRVFKHVELVSVD